MEQIITDEQLISLLEGEANNELEQQVASDSKLQKRLNELQEVMNAMDSVADVEVPSHVSFEFQRHLEKEKNKNNQGPWMQIAAAVALLIIGFGAGKFSGPDSTKELALLKDEIESLKEVTLTNTLQNHSASERIMAVNRIEESEGVNPELLVTLVNTLNTDESPSVRYAALQALKNFINNNDVRAELVKSLESQTDPLIQISLITLLVEAEEKSAIAPLQKIIKNQEVAPDVKKQAEVAIQVLT